MFAWLNLSNEIIVIALLATIVVLLAAIVWLVVHSIKLRRIMKNCPSGKLDETIIEYYDKVEALMQEMRDRDLHMDHLEKLFLSSAQKIGYVRYSGFGGVGGDLSYSLALLDGKNNGIVLTGICSRDISNTYMKPIREGISDIPLSKEEESALQMAREKKA